MSYKTGKDIFSSPWPGLILITITAVIIYSNIYNAPFVFDDIRRIVEDEKIRNFNHYFSLDRILKPMGIVSGLTFAFNYKLCELSAVGYHLVNNLIHILNGFLVYFLSLTIYKKLNKTSRFPDATHMNGETTRQEYLVGRGQVSKNNVGQAIGLMSLFAALIFVAHPIQTEAVTYTCQRTTSIAAMFYMASVFFYLKARIAAQGPGLEVQSKHPFGFYILSGICGVLAFLSKTNTGSLPGAILLVEYMLINRTWQSWKRMIPWFTVSFVLWFVFMVYVLGLFSGEFSDRSFTEDISSLSKETVTVSRWQYLCTQFNVIVIYLRLLFLPVNQNLDYLYPFKDGFFDGYTPIAFLFLTGLVVFGVWRIKKRPVISLAIFWFFITLSVESSIIPIRDAYFEHRLYLPMFGFAIFSSWLLFHFFPTDDNPHKRPWVIVTYVIIIISLGTATYYRNMVWQDEITLWSDVVSKDPKNHRAHVSLGVSLARIGNLVDAKSHYFEALRINSDYTGAHYNLGNVLTRQDKFDKAMFHYKEVLRTEPNYVEAHNNLGYALLRQNELDKAIFHCKEALRINPDFAVAHNNLGNAFLRQNKIDKAIFHCKEALRINPDRAEAHYNLGKAFVKKGKYDEAILHYEEVLRINPNSLKAHKNLGFILAEQKEYDRALVHFSEALRINPNDADAHYNIALALDFQGRIKNSITEYREALRLGPNMLEALDNLAWIFATSKNPKFRNAAEAVKLAEKACKLTARKHPLMLDTLAAAYAEAGRFDDALQTARKAMEIASFNGQVKMAGNIEKRMQLYKSGRPFYENTVTLTD